MLVVRISNYHYYGGIKVSSVLHSVKLLHILLNMALIEAGKIRNSARGSVHKRHHHQGGRHMPNDDRWREAGGVLSWGTGEGLNFLESMLKKKRETSWGWAVPSSTQLRLATTSLELCTSLSCLLSQLWLDLEAWVNCSLETTDTVLGLDEIAE